MKTLTIPRFLEGLHYERVEALGLAVGKAVLFTRDGELFGEDIYEPTEPGEEPDIQWLNGNNNPIVDILKTKSSVKIEVVVDFSAHTKTVYALNRVGVILGQFSLETVLVPA